MLTHRAELSRAPGRVWISAVLGVGSGGNIGYDGQVWTWSESDTADWTCASSCHQTVSSQQTRHRKYDDTKWTIIVVILWLFCTSAILG